MKRLQSGLTICLLTLSLAWVAQALADPLLVDNFNSGEVKNLLGNGATSH